MNLVVLESECYFSRIANSMAKKNAICSELEKKMGLAFANAIKSEIGQSSTRSRLLYHKDDPLGLVIFNNYVTKKNKELNIKNALQIKYLIILDKGAELKDLVSKKMIDKVIKEAQILKAKNLYAIVKNQDQIFANNNFQEMVIKDYGVNKETCSLFTKEVPQGNNNLVANERSSKRKFIKEEKGNDNDYIKESDNKRNKINFENTDTDKNIPIRRKVEGKMHSCTLKKIYLDQIRSGSKIVEGRINSGMFSKMNEGDSIKFFCGNGNQYTEVICKINKIEKFDSFKAMLEKVGYQKCLPECNSASEAANEYSKIPRYDSKAKMYGVLALHITRI